MNRPLRPQSTEMTVIDLFAGVGGLSLGAARAGFNVMGAVELDKHAIAAHAINFPNTTHIAEDIAQLDGKAILNRLGLKEGELGGIIGGPPCQGFSLIGKNQEGDPRNEMFSTFFKLVNEIRPKFFLAENVPGILQVKNKDFVNNAISQVADTYKMLRPMTLAANDFGAPTTRKRVFFIGIRSDQKQNLKETDFAPSQNIELITVRKALKGLEVHIDPEWQSAEESWKKANQPDSCDFSKKLWGAIPEGVGNQRAIKRLKKEQMISGSFGTRHSAPVSARYAKVLPGKSDNISKSRKLELDGFCPTLRAGTGPERGSYQAVRPLHPTENRVITPREAARLQGFPDWFQFAPSKWHSFRQIGNSVSPLLAEQIFKILRKAIKK